MICRGSQVSCYCFLLLCFSLLSPSPACHHLICYLLSSLRCISSVATFWCASASVLWEKQFDFLVSCRLFFLPRVHPQCLHQLHLLLCVVHLLTSRPLNLTACPPLSLSLLVPAIVVNKPLWTSSCLGILGPVCSLKGALIFRLSFSM